VEKLFKLAASSMNYLFLKIATGKLEEFDGYLKDELQVFFSELSELAPNIPAEFYDIVKTELDEGAYTSEHSYEQFVEMLANAIGEIMGEVDENVYNFYTYLVGTVIEENEKK
jgi:hypothetical protein